MSPREEKESWNRYQKVVLGELSNHSKALEELAKALKENNKDTSDIKTEMKSELVRLVEALKDMPEMKRQIGCLAVDFSAVKTRVDTLVYDSERIDDLEDAHGALSREVGENNVAAGMWGSISGGITGVITAISLYFTSGSR